MPGLPKRVKIADVAERAQVSTGTVDRVLHNRGEVKTKTREKVLKIIEEMNYQPDIVARTLASKKAYRFASLIPEAESGSQFWAYPLEGINQATEQVKHFGVAHEPFFFKYFDRKSFSNATKRLLKSCPDGVILAPVFSDLVEGFMANCGERKTPVVFINSNNHNLEKLSFVGQDSHQSGMVAAKLLHYGMPENAKILIINFRSPMGTNLHILSREEGFRNFFASKPKCEINLETLNVLGGDASSVQQTFNSLLLPILQGGYLGGIFVSNSRVSTVADYLKEQGYSGIKLVGYDLLPANNEHLRDNTIDFLISQNPFEQGYKSLISLFDSIVLKRTVSKHQYLPIDIITSENIDFYLNN